MISKKIAGLAAASLLAMSSAAAAQTAAPLSLVQSSAVQRAGTSAERTNELRGTTGWIIGAIALALIIWGAIELLDDDDSESP